MIVTIDGPAGSGKSTAARGLAARLGFEFLDTGAMYRAVALALARLGLDPASEQAAQALSEVRIELAPGHVLLDGDDVTEAIRTPAITAASSRVAVVPAIRHYLMLQQRLFAAGRRVVCEGRDQGTVVFPEAEYKFFLTASPLARARRRHQERLARGESVTFESVLAEQEERDRRDAGRELAPMRPAPDAMLLDTSDLSPEAVVDHLEREVRRCSRG